MFLFGEKLKISFYKPLLLQDRMFKLEQQLLNFSQNLSVPEDLNNILQHTFQMLFYIARCF